MLRRLSEWLRIVLLLATSDINTRAQRRASGSPDAKLTVDQNPITSEVRIDKQVEVVSHSSSSELLGAQLESASDQTSAAGDEPVC